MTPQYFFFFFTAFLFLNQIYLVTAIFYRDAARGFPLILNAAVTEALN